MRKPLPTDDMDSTQFEEFCFDLLRELGFVNIDWRKGTGLAASPSDSGRDIVAQLCIVRVIEPTDRLSPRLLMVVASCGARLAMDRNILWRYANVCCKSDRPLTPTRFAQAMDLLQRFSLFESKIITGYPSSEDIAMHELTKNLLKQGVVGDELGAIAVDFTYLSMTYAQQSRNHPQLVPGDAAIEALTTHLIMIALCGEVIISQHPPGAAAKIIPELRPQMESYLAFWILRAQDGLRQTDITWRLPQRWVEWATAYVQEHDDLVRLMKRLKISG